MNQQVWDEEQHRVRMIVQSLHKRIEQAEQTASEYKAEVRSIRKHFWDDVTVNTSSSEDLIETYASIKQQAEVLSERERTYQHFAKSMDKMKKLAKSPYFGRIDFTEDGDTYAEVVYIGIASFTDEENHTHLIYDWRAPISSLYYDYLPGPVSFETPSGAIDGDMSLKRQFVIHEDRIQAMFDADITIGDELLQEALSQNSDHQMKSIVATIQMEQNKIIRNDHSHMLIVQGAAGSGKTSAALQRVAYLLYKHRNTLSADQIVLFSPNPLFNSYVSHVLPELGEDNMQQTTFQEYIEHRLGRMFELEDPFMQMEAILSAEEWGGASFQARRNGIAFKSSEQYLKAIYAYQERLLQEGMRFHDLAFHGSVIVSGERIRDQFYQFASSFRMGSRLERIQEWLLKEINRYQEKQLREQWVEEEVELLEPEEYDRAYRHLQKQESGKSGAFTYHKNESEWLARYVLKKQSKPVRQMVKQLGFVDVEAMYRQLFLDESLLMTLIDAQNIPDDWHAICKQTLDQLAARQLFYEDTAPYLLFLELVKGFRSNTQIRHVIIDELQDYSPFQLAFLKRLFPRSRMTALGDLNQAIFQHTSILHGDHPIIQLYDMEKTEVVRLMRCYRSTREIVTFTSGMIEHGDDIIPFNRSGEKPVVIQVSNQEQLHAEIINSINQNLVAGYESIAVICKTARECLQAYEALRSHMDVRHITSNSTHYERGVLILPAYLAKGVEFDVVMIYNGSREAYAEEHVRKLFYTACTRAMHVLHVYVPGELSPFIVQPHTYSLRRPPVEIGK